MTLTDAPSGSESSDLTCLRKVPSSAIITNDSLSAVSPLPTPCRGLKWISRSSTKKPTPPFTLFSNQSIPTASQSSNSIRTRGPRWQRGDSQFTLEIASGAPVASLRGDLRAAFFARPGVAAATTLESGLNSRLNSVQRKRPPIPEYTGLRDGLLAPSYLLDMEDLRVLRRSITGTPAMHAAFSRGQQWRNIV